MPLISQLDLGLVLSWRYLYTPSIKQSIKLLLSIKKTSRFEDFNRIQQIAKILKRSSFSQFYDFRLIDGHFLELNWVHSVSEVIKHAELINPPGLTGYLPHSFETHLQDNEFSLLNFLQSAGYQDLILEISLQTHNPVTEPTHWKPALDDLVERLNKSEHRKNPETNQALQLYRKYQTHYANTQLFTYNIKALGKNPTDTFAILQTLLELTTPNTAKPIPSILTFQPGDARFQEHLQATENVQVVQTLDWEGWQTETGQQLAQKSIKDTIQSGGILSSLDDGSLSFPTISSRSTFSQPQQPSLSTSTNANPNPNSSDLVLRKDSSLAKIFQPQHPKVEHLKPLQRLTTYEEIQGFLQFFTPPPSTTTTNPPTLSAEEIFNQYKHLITSDTYIIGLDDNGNPVTSSWAEIPHRLIAGSTGAGKTNFINWLIFQFLYVNPRRKVYIADFKGIDFNYLKKLSLSIEIVNSVEGCQEMVEKINRKEYTERVRLMQEIDADDFKDLQEEGIDIDRTLWIIDEAADIADESSSLKKTIEKCLKQITRKGRSFGIQILYCSQRPTSEVITKQVLDQCEEKVVFRVSNGASQLILGGDIIAGDIPKNARGRAWLDGSAGRMFVNVPKMEKPKGTKIPISKTLWRYFESE
ncbi:FtsK/SpoIIIE domain-containing protein [Roseofilum sp. BLCC_M154]|uniref:FtsK/SpoIIIE domain-containing protein n=1 Tax=Roseofilum acuticapitatum BLCC-M154 TaxID=3022444 RepID=A0ABT7AX66_9CYAN|nr:FtsK/SpoIIIE domain-containing protein [Roseofilum acuticapitatum]MDJ1171509.1 FtsK/SpoIIIE domain-containing protein [Roseofilum acuticapitatum BLCC-M154]